ncbi:MAG: cyclodeaminase/cyclohydrolase family protein [Acidobacteriota bacterium]
MTTLFQPDYLGLWENSLAQFRDRVAAGSPTPGGAAVAAVSATFAAALLQMVCAISAKRNPETIKAIVANVKSIEEELGRYADEDIRAFDRYMAAKKVRNECSARDAHQCLLECTEVPLAAAEVVAKLEAYATAMIPETPEFLESELATARLLLGASREALLASVKANLKGLETGEAKNAIVRRLNALPGESG